MKRAGNVSSPHIKTAEIKVYLPAETKTVKPGQNPIECLQRAATDLLLEEP